jgi:hypothetical protein
MGDFAVSTTLRHFPRNLVRTNGLGAKNAILETLPILVTYNNMPFKKPKKRAIFDTPVFSGRNPESGGVEAQARAHPRSPSGAMGMERSRMLEAAKIALPTAGAMHMIGVSPAPADGTSLRSTNTTSILGRSLKRGRR